MTSPNNFASVTLRGVTFRPARFCAPLAGFTHSAFRQLLGELGGCGAVWSEMLSARYILLEDLQRSTWLRRGVPGERLIYQLMIKDDEQLDEIIDRLGLLAPDGLDVNLACHSPNVRQYRAGSRLYQDAVLLERVLRRLRARWPGLLLVKIRLGSEEEPWQSTLAERIRLFEDLGIDAITLHPRFFEDRFRRRARHEYYAWVRERTRLPLIANGDIERPESLARQPALASAADAIMLGRVALIQPWIFAAWDHPITLDYAAVWRRMLALIEEHFIPRLALVRTKMFAEYYARNFTFGHSLYVAIQNAGSLPRIREIADAFLDAQPEVNPTPSPMGL